MKRKQRNSSASVPTSDRSNLELQQLKSYLDSKKAERLSKQRENLPTVDNQTTFVCVLNFVFFGFIFFLEIIKRMESF
jgi:hypothetical protein